MRRCPLQFLILCILAAAGPATVAHAGDATGKTATDRWHYWSYQPISHPTPPAVKDAAWPRNDIDRFILADLEARGLKPVADAAPATLLRRVYFDLIGLPPTPEQIDAFLHDPSPDRYARLVDRLLDSPQFGQRWGRHWLDVARFGESLTLRGFLLKDAWRYRDYVIDSFNQDRPFDLFMREQVSGDLMSANSIEERRRQLIATEFLALGNINLEEQDKKQLEMDVVDEQINAIGTAFLAQTIGCARCHDHKFDPIPTRDYYALAGILHSTQTLEHANVSKHLDIYLPMEPARERVVEKQEAAVLALKTQLASVRLAIAKSNRLTGLPASAPNVAVEDLPGVVIDDAQAKKVGTWIRSTSVKPYVGDGYLTDNGDAAESKTLTFQPDTLESGKYEVRFAYTPASNRATNAAVSVFSSDADKSLRVNEQELPTVDGHFVSLGVFNFERGGQAYVLVSNEGANGHVVADAVQFLPADAAGAGHDAPPAAVASANAPGATQDVKQLEAELKKLIATGPRRDEIGSVRESKIIADARITIRGNVHSLGDVAPRGFLHAVAMDDPPKIPAGQSGRLQLGEWLANPQNPLPARVMANRAWHWLFGAGIVRTVDNFGTTGELPANQKLLDFLARQFVAGHWSVKSLVREIVLSHAYQLSAADNPGDLAADPENRLVWRMNRRRLDAECLRDSMLLISGRLTPCAGGPQYARGLASDFAFKQTATCPSVYLPAFRNSRPELFEAFDCADPSVGTGRRNVSTVAPQALFMLNSAFVAEQSKGAAARLLADPSLSDDSARISQAYRLVLGRAPSEAERKVMLNFVKGADSASDQARWEQVFHALFASIDFRYAY